MAFVPKGCVNGYVAAHVSIEIVTNPWNDPANFPDRDQPRHRDTSAAQHRQQESVSGTLRISDMAAPRKIPPGSGWRKFVYLMTIHGINFGESPAERHYLELRERIRRHIRKQYVVAVVAGKGGVGKTTMTACIGAVFR